MAQKLTASIPANLHLPADWKLRFTALDPTTGAVVSGVNVSHTSMIVTNVGDGTADDLVSGSFMLVPGPGA